MIRDVDRLKIAGKIELPDKTPRIVLADKVSGARVEVPGLVLEAQYQLGSNLLVLITEDCLFEETLHIYYFDKHLELLDSLELSAWYSPGILGDISSRQNEVSFSFFDSDERWVLRVDTEPRFSIFRNRYPVKRPTSVFRKSWLSLKKS